ncbi:MAG TPA: universal stress protein [Oligoflexus sp.]|uniref:universal stress protein n=1 Tax=Oligoflexus sp. TaxID=1971216 RepID=UPI002D66E41C|nr:universal stress protein [Oligoflexus sp.]HYX36648.1 universal stress protein [Oligoflexus sp.]
MKTANWNPRSKPIVVGVSLDKSDEPMIQSASALARRLGSPLELVHATQPIFNYMGAGDVVVNPYYGYDRVINDMEDEESRKGLEKLRLSLPQDLRIGTHVLRDYTSEALTTIALEVQAGLIMCGMSKRAGHNLFEGISTAFSLAAHADIPVLILPSGVPQNFAERPRIVVADNLQLEGRCALAAAIQMAISMECSEFGHAHVHKLSHAGVHHMVDKVRAAMNLGKIQPNPEFTAASYTEQLRAKISEDLRSRFQNIPGAQDVASRYEALVSFGQPAEELQKITQNRRPQLLIFGRHHLFHRQRFSIGKIPYDAMMEEGVATMIVPDAGSIEERGNV